MGESKETGDLRTTRTHLPATRASITRRIEHVGDLDIYITVGFYEPQRDLEAGTGIEQPGEVFIKIGKEGSTVGGLLDSVAVLMSLMLQYGVPWERIARKLRHTRFDPVNTEGKSIIHAVVSAVDEILSNRGSLPDRGCKLC